uniref:Transposon protein, putative, unclassified n=1 Tax=Oryza sativa subsp. japonica TaxID=39947 RepID=H2KWK9_ORYSJ|nr:transposon protein, putative, unclassified [Oryza sativa Japonica Group]ABG22594.1 transposon protein, putative, unclassified [Oryza sativa Japonica Group]
MAALGRAEWLPRGARPSAARALGVKAFFLSVSRVDAAASEDPLFVEVEADVWESEQGKSHHP